MCIWAESSAAPFAYSPFESFFELIAKESIENRVGCTVHEHQHLKVRLQNVHVPMEKITENNFNYNDISKILKLNPYHSEKGFGFFRVAYNSYKC